MTMSHERKNPFVGARSYEENDKDSFYGRSMESKDLLQLIKINSFTLLYGRSGLGKSSVIKAGLFPLLRENGYLPIYLKPNYNNPETNLIKEIEKKITEFIANENIEVREIKPKETLWEYFHEVKFKYKQNDSECIPVLIFDQFEEIFTLGTENKSIQFRENTRLLIGFISDIIENIPPDSLDEETRTNLKYNFTSKENPVKVLFSFREEYLSDFYSLSKLIPSIAYSNLQYRLNPLSYNTAFEIVSKASKGLFNNKAIHKILRLVCETENEELAKTKDIDSFILSIICENQFNKNEKKDEITEGDISDTEVQSLINDLYESAVSDLELNEEEKKLLEDKLLNNDGNRLSLKLKNIYRNSNIRKEKIDKLIERKIIRNYKIEGEPNIEIIHDKFADVIKVKRDLRLQNEERERKLNEIIEENKRLEEVALLQEQIKQNELEQIKVEAEKEKANRKRKQTYYCLLLVIFIALGVSGALYLKNKNEGKLKVALRKADSLSLIDKKQKEELQLKSDDLGILTNDLRNKIDSLKIKENVILELLDSAKKKNIKLTNANKTIDSLRQLEKEHILNKSKEKEIKLIRESIIDKLANNAQRNISSPFGKNLLALAYAYNNILADSNNINKTILETIYKSNDFNKSSYSSSKITSLYSTKENLFSSTFNSKGEIKLNKIINDNTINIYTGNFLNKIHIKTLWIDEKNVVLVFKDTISNKFNNFLLNTESKISNKIDISGAINQILFSKAINKTFVIIKNNQTYEVKIWQGIFENKITPTIYAGKNKPIKIIQPQRDNLYLIFQSGQILNYKVSNQNKNKGLNESISSNYILSNDSNYIDLKVDILDAQLSSNNNIIYLVHPSKLSYFDLSKNKIVYERMMNFGVSFFKTINFEDFLLLYGEKNEIRNNKNYEDFKNATIKILTDKSNTLLDIWQYSKNEYGSLSKDKIAGFNGFIYYTNDNSNYIKTKLYDYKKGIRIIASSISKKFDFHNIDFLSDEEKKILRDDINQLINHEFYNILF